MKEQTPKLIRVTCGELCTTTECTATEINLLHIDRDDLLSNITIGYERYLEDSEKLPDRIIDLLQIAAYVFCGDRMANRGSRDSINNESWSRSFEFNIPVMDIEFWENGNTKKLLSDVLTVYFVPMLIICNYL